MNPNPVRIHARKVRSLARWSRATLPVLGYVGVRKRERMDRRTGVGSIAMAQRPYNVSTVPGTLVPTLAPLLFVRRRRTKGQTAGRIVWLTGDGIGLGIRCRGRAYAALALSALHPWVFDVSRSSKTAQVSPHVSPSFAPYPSACQQRLAPIRHKCLEATDAVVLELLACCMMTAMWALVDRRSTSSLFILCLDQIHWTGLDHRGPDQNAKQAETARDCHRWLARNNDPRPRRCQNGTTKLSKA